MLFYCGPREEEFKRSELLAVVLLADRFRLETLTFFPFPFLAFLEPPFCFFFSFLRDKVTQLSASLLLRTGLY